MSTRNRDLLWLAVFCLILTAGLAALAIWSLGEPRVSFPLVPKPAAKVSIVRRSDGATVHCPPSTAYRFPTPLARQPETHVFAPTRTAPRFAPGVAYFRAVSSPALVTNPPAGPIPAFPRHDSSLSWAGFSPGKQYGAPSLAPTLLAGGVVFYTTREHTAARDRCNKPARMAVSLASREGEHV
jgi:hypothetical protein